jgi:Domain of unknown function (DUF397)
VPVQAQSAALPVSDVPQPWRKTGHSGSNGDCAEVAAWRASRRSYSEGNCVEVGQGRAVVGVRDSKDPESPVLVFRGETWAAFTARLKAGGTSWG